MSFTPPQAKTDHSGELSVPVLLLIVLQKLHIVLRVSLGFAVLNVAVLLLLPRRWVAEGSFVPESRRTASELASLSGLAAQFGFALGEDNTPSGAFYSALLASHELLGAIVDHSYTVTSPDGVRTGTLVDFYRTSGATAALRRERAIRRLSHELTADFSQKTGIVDFRVQTRDPQLALQVAGQALAELTRFNVDRRQSRAAAERVFTEGRRDEVRKELRDAEDALTGFLQRNRDYRNSPGLSLEFDRLSREASLRQQIYASVSQAYEQARIEEVRDTPVLTVVDPPQLPVSPERRGLWWKTAIVLLVSAGFVLVLALVREAALPTAGGEDEVAQLSALWHATMRDVHQPWRLFAARKAGTG